MATTARITLIEHGSDDYFEALRLRDEILVNPEGRVTTAEDIEAEKQWVHVAGFEGGVLRATCLLVPERDRVRMKRVAVAADAQGRGIGSRLLTFCETHARDQGAIELYAHARQTAVPFYDKAGYSLEGDYFDEVGIPHLLVRKPL